MCGISGVYSFDQRGASLDTAKLLGSRLAHRGPDNFGCWAFDYASFAHNRLSFLDFSHTADQPFKNDDFALVYNGEIYNFKQLRQGLVDEFNVEFRTTSDTEVLFYSLIYRGVNRTLDDIRGMFTFAFYDRHNHQIFLARDRLGIKPLYYCVRNGKLYWSSELKALASVLESLRSNPDTNGDKWKCRKI